MTRWSTASAQQPALSLPACMLVLLCGLLQSAWVPADEDRKTELDEAIALYRAEGAAAALPEFKRLLAGFEAAQDEAGETLTRRYIGESYWRLGEFERSRGELDRAVSLARKTGDRSVEGRALNVLGLLEWDIGQYDRALAMFREAHAIAVETDDSRLAASTLNNRGLVQDERGDYSASLQDYEQALSLFGKAGDRRGQGDALGNIGGVHLLLGRYRPALEYYRRALKISEELGSKPSMTIDHGNIALCLLGLGRADEAIGHFDRALQLARESGMSQEEAYWQRGKAGALVSQGRYGPGLEQYRAALKTYEEMGANSLLLDARHDLGMLMLTLGDPASAESQFQNAIELAREIGNQRALTANLLALGDLHYRRDRPEEAEALYGQAYQRAQAAGEVNLEVEGLLRLAQVDRSLGIQDRAGRLAAEAVGLSNRVGAVLLEAESWFAVAEAARGRSRADQALAAYERAGDVMQSPGDPDLLWRIRYGRARTFEQAQRLEDAVQELLAAVRIIEGVRERLREERFRSGWVEDKYRVYMDLVRLQLRLGNTRAAFAAAERLKARNFLAQMEQGPLPQTDHPDAGRVSELRGRIRHLQRMLAAEQERELPDRRQMAIQAFSAELVRAEREYQSLLDDRRVAHPRRVAVQVPELEAIQQRLEPHEALIEFVMADDDLMTFILRRGGLTAVTLPAPGAELTARVDLLRELIQQPDGQGWRGPARALGALLIDPLLEGEALDGVSHLSLVPHGVLNYLPFAALLLGPDTDGLLIEKYTLSYLPAAAALAVESTPTRSVRTLLALAPAASRLKHAPREARSVAAMFKADADLLVGPSATESAVKARAADFRVLHFATHGLISEERRL